MKEEKEKEEKEKKEVVIEYPILCEIVGNARKELNRLMQNLSLADCTWMLLLDNLTYPLSSRAEPRRRHVRRSSSMSSSWRSLWRV
jgi:hypothetical protein